MRLTVLSAVTLLVAFPSFASAQGENPREVQLRMLGYQRKMLLAMADSMPERLYRDKATPTQRDFAQQVHHAASTAAYVASAVLKGPPVTLPDTSVALNSRAGLEQYINAAFTYAEGVFNREDATARQAEVSLFGKKMPTWQVWDEVYTHTVYMGGQVVGNFRKQGMAPPAFTFF